ncbi:LysR family transcriptional regulator [Saccharospirillum sp. HFRX-1]|uniref:LysR family transcriptional regulator n=1 Tax=unclassified Saccharospirillum TaxID=2633430 RepID=UPI0037166E6D
MNWQALYDFNLVAHHGGFGEAARASGRPKATLSRHAKELEDALGLRLLERGHHKPRLTEEGRRLYERSNLLLNEIEDLTLMLSEGREDPRGLLRISAPALFSDLVMGRIAAIFVQQYPQVTLEVVADDRAADPVEDGFDLVIRINPNHDSELMGRCFARDHLVVVSAPNQSLAADATEVDAILLANPGTLTRWNLHTDAGNRTLIPTPRLRLSTLRMVRDAVRTGLGWAALPYSMVQQDLATKRLVMHGRLVNGAVEVWALYHQRRLLSSKVTAFMALLQAEFSANGTEQLADYLSGNGG